MSAASAIQQLPEIRLQNIRVVAAIQIQYANSPKYRAFFSRVVDCDVLNLKFARVPAKLLSTRTQISRSFIVGGRHQSAAAGDGQAILDNRFDVKLPRGSVMWASAFPGCPASSARPKCQRREITFEQAPSNGEDDRDFTLLSEIERPLIDKFAAAEKESPRS